MIATKTLQKYIDRCSRVIENNDLKDAESLEKEIVSVLGKDIENIRGGLDNYSPCLLASAIGGRESSTNNKVNFIDDIKLLKSKLEAELDKAIPEDFDVANCEKPNKVFISHSKKDIQYVSLFVNLLEDIGLSEDEMVCSSIPDYGIPLRADIYDWLSRQFQDCNLHVIFILSDNYYHSVACLNEMGAAWVLRQKYDLVLLPGFDFPQIEGAINPQQIGIKLDSEPAELKKRLGELKDSIKKEFELKSMSASKWERHRDEFIERLNTIINNSTDEKTKNMTFSENDKNDLSKDASILLVYGANSASGQIVISRSLTGMSINVDDWEFLNSDSAPREEARWLAATEELEYNLLVKAAGNKRQLFCLTKKGYEFADIIKEKLNVDTDKSPDEYL